MIYLVFGDQYLMIKKRVIKIVKDIVNEPNEFNFINFDLETNSIFEVIEEANLFCLGCDRKVVYVKNCYFFDSKLLATKEKAKQEMVKNELSYLINYINNQNPEVDLVLSFNTVNLDKNNEVYKAIYNNKGKIYELVIPSDDDWVKYVNTYFKEMLKVEIDNNAVAEFVSRISKDTSILVNEATKLALYTNHITYSDVVKLVNKPLDAKIYEIYGALMKHKNELAILKYRELLGEKYDVNAIISSLTDSFLLLLKIKTLAKEAASYEKYFKETNIKNPKRIDIIKKEAALISFDDIHRIIENLYDLDSKIKSGLIPDRFYSFEMFLTRFTY